MQAGCSEASYWAHPMRAWAGIRDVEKKVGVSIPVFLPVGLSQDDCIPN